MEVDNNTPIKQPIDDHQKYAYNNPYAVLAQQETSQNEAQNLEQLNEDNNEGVNEQNEYTKSKMEREKEDRMETASNITIDGEDATEKTEAKKISYSEAVRHYQRKRTNKVIECRVDNRWTKEVKSKFIDILKKECLSFDCDIWDYDRMIEAIDNPEILVTLIKHKITIVPKNYLYL
ncbi:hypothetical protein F8M41_020456 [Gigaspora margarita]|uniref:Uncharacterized protein n=1 Tax=Gigaspora margarita TaxID=4874 RepID=A0A8H4AIF7_GIGMA|nr:hypothetical protein F8M41_020456 [Gigaspora margarita]